MPADTLDGGHVPLLAWRVPMGWSLMPWVAAFSTYLGSAGADLLRQVALGDGAEDSTAY